MTLSYPLNDFISFGRIRVPILRPNSTGVIHEAPIRLTQNRLRPALTNHRAGAPDPRQQIDLVGGRAIGTLSEAHQARPQDHRMALVCSPEPIPI